MSLAEDLRRPFDGNGRHGPVARIVPKETDRGLPATVRTLRTDARRSADTAPADAARDSMNLLDRASKSVVFLLNRYQQLEEHIRQLDSWSKAQIQAAESAATRWQESAADAETKMHALQTALEAMRGRAEVAEHSLQRDARTLEKLQEQISSAFGVGSEAHDALAAIGLT